MLFLIVSFSRGHQAPTHLTEREMIAKKTDIHARAMQDTTDFQVLLKYYFFRHCSESPVRERGERKAGVGREWRLKDVPGPKRVEA